MNDSKQALFVQLSELGSKMRALALLAILFGSCMGPALASASTSPEPVGQTAQPRLTLSLGTLVGSSRVVSRYDVVDALGATLTGTPIGAESDLGLSDQGGWRALHMQWRFGRAWLLDFDRLWLERSGSTAAPRELVVRWWQYPAGTPLESRLRVSVGTLSLGYALIDSPSRLTLLAGLHSASHDFELRGQAAAIGFDPAAAPAPTRFQDDQSRVAGSLGLAYSGAMGPRGAADFRLQVQKGSGLDLSLGWRWQWNPHLGARLGWRLARGRVDEVICFLGCSSMVLDYRVHGPQLLLQARL